eukprot:6201453-Pleurochrysis_carterae.AAC.1
MLHGLPSTVPASASSRRLNLGVEPLLSAARSDGFRCDLIDDLSGAGNVTGSDAVVVVGSSAFAFAGKVGTCVSSSERSARELTALRLPARLCERSLPKCFLRNTGGDCAWEDVPFRALWRSSFSNARPPSGELQLRTVASASLRSQLGVRQTESPAVPACGPAWRCRSPCARSARRAPRSH